MSKKLGLKRPVGVRKFVSKATIRKFKRVPTAKLSELKMKHLKKRTFNKMQWGVRAFSEWRLSKLSEIENYDELVFESDLKNVSGLTKQGLIHSLCMFIPEVTKVKDGSDYPGKTLYEMITSIQKYLHQNNLPWKLIDGPEFIDVKMVFDNVMKESATNNIGMVKKQAQFISLDIENDMWEKGVLGESTPDKLRETVLFLLGINLGLRAGYKHYSLRHDAHDKPSQLSFERSENNKRCLVYREDSVTKTNDGGIASLKKERKVVWIFPNEQNVNRCTVRLVDK